MRNEDIYFVFQLSLYMGHFSDNLPLGLILFRKSELFLSRGTVTNGKWRTSFSLIETAVLLSVIAKYNYLYDNCFHYQGFKRAFIGPVEKKGS